MADLRQTRDDVEYHLYAIQNDIALILLEFNRGEYMSGEEIDFLDAQLKYLYGEEKKLKERLNG